MSWFNYAGLVIVAIIMMPNIIYAIKKPTDLIMLIKTRLQSFANRSADTAVLLS